MRTLSGKPQLLKKVNSSMIEQFVFENGPISKPELAKLTGLSLPTTSKLVDDLERDSRLCSAGQSGTGAGRKATLYEVNGNSGCLLVCYYQDGYYQCRLADMQNKPLYEKSFPIDCSSKERAYNSTLHAINTLMKLASAKVKIIGIGLPGVIQSNGRLLGISQIPVWEGFNLRKKLADHYKVTVYVENNVKLSAMGYYHTHIREKWNNLVYLYVRNGIGSGIIINRQLYLGAGNFSGEIGFMAVPEQQTSRNYASIGGYLESHIGTLVDYATGELKQKDNSEQRKELISMISAIVVNHVAVLNPNIIVLSGKIFSKDLVEELKSHMSCYLHEGIMPKITRDLSNDMGLEGLIRSCREYITTGIHLVQWTGMTDRITKVAV